MNTTTQGTDDRELLERIERAAAERAEQEETAAEAAAQRVAAEAQATDHARRQEAMQAVEVTIDEAIKTSEALTQCAAEWRRLCSGLAAAPVELRRVLVPFGRERGGLADLGYMQDFASEDELALALTGKSLAIMSATAMVTLEEVVRGRAKQLTQLAERMIQPPRLEEEEV